MSMFYKGKYADMDYAPIVGHKPKIVICSGFFAPINTNHIDYLIDGKLLSGINGKLVVVLNNDEELAKKKDGLVVQTQAERYKILRAIKYVDEVWPVPMGMTSTDVSLQIQQYNPNYKIIVFNAGDRHKPELCDPDEVKRFGEAGIEMAFGSPIKTNSSSNIIERVINWYKEKRGETQYSLNNCSNI